jgi:hypothetical protein
MGPTMIGVEVGASVVVPLIEALYSLPPALKYQETPARVIFPKPSSVAVPVPQPVQETVIGSSAKLFRYVALDSV